MIITDKQNTFCGWWPERKENTYFGFKTEEDKYIWYKDKRSAIRNIKNKKGWIMKATLIGNNMFINTHYARERGW